METKFDLTTKAALQVLTTLPLSSLGTIAAAMLIAYNKDKAEKLAKKQMEFIKETLKCAKTQGVKEVEFTVNNDSIRSLGASYMGFSLSYSWGKNDNYKVIARY